MVVALGFSDHSGWAVMAAVRRAGPANFELLFRRRLETCPPNLPRQVYHAVAEQGLPRATIERVMTAASELSRSLIDDAIRDAGGVSVAAVAMGASVIPTDLGRVLASHSLLHAAEGALYRDALCDAAALAGLRVVRFLNKEVRSQAAASLGWTLDALESWLAETGRAAGTPWTKDEKDASVAAMLALATVT